MKKLILLISLFFLFSSPVFALIVTDNVDKDDFQYEVPYVFATPDLAASKTEVTIPIDGNLTNSSGYTIPRDGKLVGISVWSSGALTGGAATFDVTINEAVTGVQAVIEPNARTAIGNSGSSGMTYAYMRQDRADKRTHQGFNLGSSPSYYDAEHKYGKATPITAGNRIGVKATTSSGFTPDNTDYVVVVYVLE